MNGRAKSVSTVRAETHGDTGARKSQLTDLHLANHEIKVTKWKLARLIEYPLKSQLPH